MREHNAQIDAYRDHLAGQTVPWLQLDSRRGELVLIGSGSEGRPVNPYAPTAHASAVRDFRAARRGATIERILARLRGKSADLLCFSQLRELQWPTTSPDIELRTIPLNAIVGSVERCTDYTRGFLPAQDHDQQRWTRVWKAVGRRGTMAPIDVLQIGQVYFVIDGHHRVSIARQRAQAQLDARVVQITTRVPLTANLQPGEFRLRAEYAAFLEHTRLDEIHPLVDLSVTVPGQYTTLEAQIDQYVATLRVERAIDLSLAEAAGGWFEQVYRPRLEHLRALGICQEFPGRTETDIYVWVSQHRANLEGALGWEVELDLAASDLVRQTGPRPRRRLARARTRLRNSVTPVALRASNRAGAWRRQRASRQLSDAQVDDCLFTNILVPCGGSGRDWPAVAQAAELACREGAQLLGLHVAPTKMHITEEQTRAMREEFERHCRVAGIQAKMQVEVGAVASRVYERSRWADLVVLGMAHPPAANLSARLTSSLCNLVRRSPTPILAVPGAFSPLSRPLLAYDGGPKAREALYVATYLATRGEVPLTVVSVAQDHLDAQSALDGARVYLEDHDVAATYLKVQGPVAPTLLQTAREVDADLILMGGYGHAPLREVILGSAVDEVLRGSEIPVFICC